MKFIERARSLWKRSYQEKVLHTHIGQLNTSWRLATIGVEFHVCGWPYERLHLSGAEMGPATCGWRNPTAIRSLRSFH